ncbi:HEAT repeat domain-containing protein [Dictyobacter formicarum]|uniref:Anaphase-promoting complex subunit 4 WD40 domain-containing protein n=1 Tax=Dictyobacter formicarum TaxID=2778368 RepID=A0ABQ3VCD4_9CHLR|nr:HEAT repeat domain-containing protein [Dictyobacter formicarum]GHO83810.1 hypothetical protein KSZ_18160 [Dictyobacter formicarum]
MAKNESDHQEFPERENASGQWLHGKSDDAPELSLPPLTYLGLGNNAATHARSDEQLLADLQHPDWAVRVSALKQLGRMEARVPLDVFLAALQDEHKAVRAAAARILGTLKEDIPLAPLLGALYDSDWHVRSCVVQALGQHIQRVPLDALVYALGDQDETVRSAAVTAIGKLGERAPLDALSACLHDRSWMVREATVLALGDLGERVPRSLLLRALEDSDTNVQQAAEEVLGGLATVALQHWQSQQQSSADTFLPSLEASIFMAHEEQTPAIAQSPPPSDDVPLASDHLLPLHFLSRLTSISRLIRPVGISMLMGILLICAIAILPPPLMAPAESNHIIEYAHYHDNGGKSAGIRWLDKVQFAWADGQGTVQMANAIAHQSITMYNTSARILDLARVNHSFYTAELQQGTIKVRKDNQQTIFAIPTNSQIPVASFSPDGHYVALALNDMSVVTTISIWDTITGHYLTSYTAQQGTITAIAWPPEGDVLASVSASVDRDGQQAWKIEMWDARTGHSTLAQEPIPYLSLPRTVIGLSWSPDGTRLAYTLADGVIHVHDRVTLIDGVYNTRSTTETNWNGAIAWSPDGKYLASTNKNGEVQVWNVSGDNNDGQLVCTYMRHKTPVDAIAWVPNASIDRILSTDISGNLFVWDVKEH